MPVHDLGYRKWQGELTSPRKRWWIIARSGLRIAWKSAWVKRLIFVAWMPVLYWGLAFFFIEQMLDEGLQQRIQDVQQSGEAENATDDGNGQRENQRLENDISIQTQGLDANQGARDLADMPGMNELIPGWDRVSSALASDSKNEARHILWSLLLMSYFRYPQGMLTLFLIGMTVPPLISRDLRSRAYLLYFSRPIGRWEYIFGKLAIPASFLVLISTFPALVLYLFGILMSPSLDVVLDTWDIPLRVIAASACLVIPTSCLSLMLSSLTHESRFAAFAWFTIWGIGAATWGIIYAATLEDSYLPVEDNPWQLVSLYSVLGNCQRIIFGEPMFATAFPSFIILTGLTAYCLAVIYRKVSAPIEV